MINSGLNRFIPKLKNAPHTTVNKGIEIIKVLFGESEPYIVKRMLNGYVVEPEFTLSELQNTKIAELYSSYNKSNLLDIPYMNTIFKADKKSQDVIVSVLSNSSVPYGFFWMDKANNQVDMTFTDLQGLNSAILDRVQINFVKLQSLITDVRNTTNQDDLDKITW